MWLVIFVQLQQLQYPTLVLKLQYFSTFFSTSPFQKYSKTPGHIQYFFIIKNVLRLVVAT